MSVSATKAPEAHPGSAFPAVDSLWQIPDEVQKHVHAFLWSKGLLIKEKEKVIR